MEVSDENDGYEEEKEDEVWQLGEPNFHNQQDLNLLNLFYSYEAGGELLESRLKEWNLLQPSVRIYKYCSDMRDCFNQIGITYQLDQ